MKKYRVFFEWGCYDCLWGDGGPVDYEKAGVSKELEEILTELGKEFQTALDWDYPQGPSPWTIEHKKDFLKRQQAAFDRLKEELKDTAELEFK